MSKNVNANKYYHDAYQEVMYTGGIGLYSKAVHHIMEYGFNNTGLRILELGAGHGEHLPYVKKPYNEYIMSDIDVTLLDSIEGMKSNAKIIQLDAEKLENIEGASFDRIIATCLLAHLTQPVAALKRWREVVKPGGVITIYVPSEPGMMLRLFRMLFVAPKSRKHGQNHMSMIYRDHKNHYPAMRQHIKDVFFEDRIVKHSFPFPFLGWNFNFFTLYKITVK
jgi:phosphatidylethanolamine/phosphatidyl-N-methylethanolamine N-methyltransferase